MSAGSYNEARHDWESISRYVKEFQRANNLTPDGYAGPLTMAKLEQVVAKRSRISKVHPLPLLPDGRRPVATNLYRRGHWGWDYFYRYQSGDVIASDDHRIIAGGLMRWWYPADAVAVAAADGVVHVAESMSTGHWVWIRHDDGYATGYFHGTSCLVNPNDIVTQGTPVIPIGHDTRSTTWDKVHLHFEVRKPTGSQDPRHWERVDPKVWLAGAGYSS